MPSRAPAKSTKSKSTKSKAKPPAAAPKAKAKPKATAPKARKARAKPRATGGTRVSQNQKVTVTVRSAPGAPGGPGGAGGGGGAGGSSLGSMAPQFVPFEKGYSTYTPTSDPGLNIGPVLGTGSGGTHASRSPPTQPPSSVAPSAMSIASAPNSMGSRGRSIEELYGEADGAKPQSLIGDEMPLAMDTRPGDFAHPAGPHVDAVGDMQSVGAGALNLSGSTLTRFQDDSPFRRQDFVGPSTAPLELPGIANADLMRQVMRGPPIFRLPSEGFVIESIADAAPNRLELPGPPVRPRLMGPRTASSGSSGISSTMPDPTEGRSIADGIAPDPATYSMPRQGRGSRRDRSRSPPGSSASPAQLPRIF